MGVITTAACYYSFCSMNKIYNCKMHCNKQMVCYNIFYNDSIEVAKQSFIR
jgi:hypothetical protein